MYIAVVMFVAIEGGKEGKGSIRRRATELCPQISRYLGRKCTNKMGEEQTLSFRLSMPARVQILTFSEVGDETNPRFVALARAGDPNLYTWMHSPKSLV